MIGDAGDDVGEPRLGIDVVEATSLDERVQDRVATAASVGAGEQIILAAKGDGTFIVHLIFKCLETLESGLLQSRDTGASFARLRT